MGIEAQGEGHETDPRRTKPAGRERLRHTPVIPGMGWREYPGLGLNGETLGHTAYLHFRAPGLLEACGRKPTTFFIIIDREGVWANARIVDPVNAIWRLMVLDTDGALTPETIDREGYLRRAIGGGIKVEWLDTSIWTRRSAMAERYSNGRVFLAGDAVHQMSPTGALGMNTGIADAVDLGWKLSAVLQGWGGEHLLASYDLERRPIGVRNVGMAAEFYLEHEKFGDGLAAIDEDSAAGADVRRRAGNALACGVGRMFRTTGLQIGYRYEASPICLPDGTAPYPDDPEEFVPSARPGSRAPHIWLGDGRSILDIFGGAFALLRFGSDAPDVSAFEGAAARRRVPVKTVVVTEPDAGELYECRLALVRPDGHVAWRADEAPANAVPVIDKVRGAVVAGSGRSH